MPEKPSGITRKDFLKGTVGLGALAALEKSGILRLLPAKAEGESKEGYPYPPSEILHFNERYNSGWFYLASTVPDENGIVFWTAPVRSFSREPVDATAELLYGITKTQTGEHYFRFLQGGSFSEDSNKVNLSYSQGGQELLRFQQTGDNLDEFQLTVNLPWVGGESYQVTRSITFNKPIIYESGDGVIPIGGGVESLCVSLALEQGIWTDFQKFDLEAYNREVIRLLNVNHRWGCFMLTEAVGSLPAGTVGVYWEILDDQNKRQPGGFTNFDLLVPGNPQVTKEDFLIEEIEHWHSSHKAYLRKWGLKQPGLGVNLVLETIVPNQENYVAGRYFYEGIAKAYNPSNPQRQVGTGMLEQTHDEMEHKIYLPYVSKGS